ncbi:hypothetical protein YC2023_098416 [Brassica napus]
MKEGFVSSYSRTLYTNSVLKSSKRGHQLIVAASPPTEEAVVATEPLTREDLIAYLASGCKTKDKWRIGTEHEKFGFEVNTSRPMKYDQIAELLNSIAERFEWEKVMEGDKIIGLKQGKQSISLEPGGQFELSGAPLETLHQTCAEVNSHLYQVKAVAEEMGIGFLGMGFQPKWRREDIPMMPKGRYDIMRNYMPKVGSLGLDMMLRTCTVQVNLDFSSEADMIRKFRVGLALQPIATALFANSPFTEGKPNGFLSMRRFLITWFSFSIYLKAFQIHKISGLEDFQTTTKKSSRRLPGSLLTESFLMSPFHNISERFDAAFAAFTPGGRFVASSSRSTVAWELADCAPSSHFLFLVVPSLLLVASSHHFWSCRSSSQAW